MSNESLLAPVHKAVLFDDVANFANRSSQPRPGRVVIGVELINNCAVLVETTVFKA